MTTLNTDLLIGMGIGHIIGIINMCVIIFILQKGFK